MVMAITAGPIADMPMERIRTGLTATTTRIGAGITRITALTAATERMYRRAF